MNPFDRDIREKLEGHRPDRPADAWQRFADRLDETERFDRTLRNKLSRHQARYQPAHWHSLRDRLDRQSRMLKDLHLSRGLELALLFLLIYTLGNLPHTGIPSTWRHTTVASTSNPQATRALALAVQEGSTGEKTSSPSKVAAEATGPQARAGSAPMSGFSTPEAWSGESGTKAPTDAAGPELLPDGPGVPESFQTETGAAETRAGSAFARVDPVDRVETSLLVTEKPLLQVPSVEAPKRFRHRISLSLGRDLHHILTPYDHLLSNRGYDQWAGGNSGSFGYTWEGRKWGIRTHLAYHDLGYLPKPFTEVFDGDMQRGYFTESIKTIELNLLSVDLQVSRSLARLGSWNLYAVAGIAGHMAILANYDRRQEFLPGTDPLPAGETPQPTRPSKISQKRFADGIIEGGGFAENSFLTLDGGFGFERHLNGRISLFQENTLRLNPFRRSLGPNNDRINSLGLTAGVRVLL